MSISIYVKNEENGEMLAISTSGRWLYDEDVNPPSWLNSDTSADLDEFKFFEGKPVSWIVIPGKLPSQLSWYWDVDEEGNLQEYSRINILNTSELVALMREHGIHTVFVTND